MADTKNGNGNDKGYRATMAKAGVGGAPADEGTGNALLTEEEAAMVTSPADDELQRYLRNKSFEFAPKNFKLKEGQMIMGFLEGNGPEAEFENDRGPSVVKTWIIRHPKLGVRLSILSSVQLDKKLDPFIGGEVYIYRGKDENIGGSKRMTNYEVWGPYAADGKPRSWAKLPEVDAKVFDAVSRPSLPSGMTDEDAVA